MKRKLYNTQTSFIDRVFIRDTSVTTGVAGLKQLLWNSSGLTLTYIKAGQSSYTQVTLSSGVVGTWSNGGFVEIGSGLMPGWYEVGIPNAAISGAISCGFHLRGATNMEDIPWQYELDQVNYQDGTRAGLTALPNANANAANGLTTFGTGTGQINLIAGRVDVSGVMGAPLNSLVAGRVDSYIGSARTPLTFDLNGSISGSVASVVTSSAGGLTASQVPVNYGSL